MAGKRKGRARDFGAVIASRAAWRREQLRLLGNGPPTQAKLRKWLKLDVGGFYRDPAALWATGTIVLLGRRQSRLGDGADEAISPLPFYDSA
jgi:hypothetical protein